MTSDLESQIGATLEERAGATERLDVGSLADRVIARGRVRRRRRAIGAAAAAAVVVAGIVVVPAWVTGTDKPVRPPVATQPPTPSSTSPSTTPSRPSSSSPQLSEGLVRRWLDSLPQLTEAPMVTGDPSRVLEIVDGIGAGADVRYKSEARMRETGQVLATGDPHGAALDPSGSRLAVATEWLGSDGQPSGTVTLIVFDVSTGETLSLASGLDLPTTVRGWLDGRVVLDTDVEVRAAVAVWDPDRPGQPPVKVADGRVVDIAESGHRILTTEGGTDGQCSEVWNIPMHPTEATNTFIRDCGHELLALSDDGRRGYVQGWQAAMDIWSGVPLRFQLPEALPVVAARWDAAGDVLLTIGLQWSGETATVSCHVTDESCARVVPSP